MHIIVTATEKDAAQMGATEQDFYEIIRANWSDSTELLSWLTEVAYLVVNQDIHEVEPFTFEPPKHEGRALMAVTVPLEEIFTGLLDCENGEMLQEAALGAIRSGEVLWRVEEYFWDIIEGGV